MPLIHSSKREPVLLNERQNRRISVQNSTCYKDLAALFRVVVGVQAEFNECCPQFKRGAVSGSGNVKFVMLIPRGLTGTGGGLTLFGGGLGPLAPNKSKSLAYLMSWRMAHSSELRRCLFLTSRGSLPSPSLALPKDSSCSSTKDLIAWGKRFLHLRS